MHILTASFETPSYQRQGTSYLRAGGGMSWLCSTWKKQLTAMPALPQLLRRASFSRMYASQGALDHVTCEEVPGPETEPAFTEQ